MKITYSRGFFYRTADGNDGLVNRTNKQRHGVDVTRKEAPNALRGRAPFTFPPKVSLHTETTARAGVDVLSFVPVSMRTPEPAVGAPVEALRRIVVDVCCGDCFISIAARAEISNSSASSLSSTELVGANFSLFRSRAPPLPIPRHGLRTEKHYPQGNHHARRCVSGVLCVPLPTCCFKDVSNLFLPFALAVDFDLPPFWRTIFAGHVR